MELSVFFTCRLENVFELAATRNGQVGYRRTIIEPKIEAITGIKSSVFTKIGRPLVTGTRSLAVHLRRVAALGNHLTCASQRTLSPTSSTTKQ